MTVSVHIETEAGDFRLNARFSGQGIINVIGEKKVSAMEWKTAGE